VKVPSYRNEIEMRFSNGTYRVAPRFQGKRNQRNQVWRNDLLGSAVGDAGAVNAGKAAGKRAAATAVDVATCRFGRCRKILRMSGAPKKKSIGFSFFTHVRLKCYLEETIVPNTHA